MHQKPSFPSDIATAQENLLRLKGFESKCNWRKGTEQAMSSLLDHEQDSQVDAELFRQKLPHHYRSVLSEFQAISRSFFLFNSLMFCLIALEGISLLSMIPLFSQSWFLALGLGALFLTLFSYLVLLFYFQAKKPEQLQTLLHRFVASCKNSLGIPPGMVQHHLSIAETLTKLFAYLQDYEKEMGRLPSVFAPLSGIFSFFSRACYYNDVFRFKQMLLYAAVDEHLQQIRSTPTDLEVHASLAATYVSLSQLYRESKTSPQSHPSQALYRKRSADFDENFQIAASLAIEEFQILSQYAPNDPWVHEQLASGYRNLEMHQEEIAEVELLLKLRPQDKDLLFRLGSLYFQQGANAKGLQLYEELKKSHYKKAEELIASYGMTAQADARISPIEL